MADHGKIMSKEHQFFPGFSIPFNFIFRTKTEERADYGGDLCGDRIQQQTSLLAKAATGCV